MAKKLKKLMAAFLAMVMCLSLISTTTFAKETINGNTWYGDELSVDVTAGTEGYTFMSLFRKPAHGYEFSGHFLGDGEGPQTFVVIDTVEYDGTTWTPSGLFDPMDSNYEVTYCCDVETMIVDGTYYKRLNLEDSEYYNEAQATQIRSVVTNSYPYVTLEDMKADLAENGFAYAEELTRNEILAAVQAAIWACANNMTAEDFRYQKSYSVTDNLQWGYPLHDTSAESGLDVSGKRVFKTYDEVGQRINSLVDYLLAQTATYADKAQIVITELKMVGAPAVVGNDEYSATLQISLNNSGSGYEDEINITVLAGDNIYEIPVVLGKETYKVEVTAKCGDEIKAIVSGTQVLPAGVYFYAPKPADVNGDGEATGREVSQNLVGAAMGETPVYAEATLSFERVDFKSGDVSNISYMFINKETGEVEFLKKIDVDEGATSAPIITADGYVSVMFMKQSTSGMFWFSEDVDEDLVDAAIDCLKANNPSYKGHNAVAFGPGSHELEFKSGKFVTYTFNAGTVSVGDAEQDDVEEEEIIEIPETPEVPKAEAPVPPAPVFPAEVKGAEAAAQAVVDGVAAIYIEAEGKIPAVVWTSEEVEDSALLDEIFEELGADPDATVVFGFGDRKIEYKQNKNKTKSVTYTFEEVEVVVEEEADVSAVERDVMEETGALLGAAAGEEPATPATPAVPSHGKSHILGDAERTPELFNFKLYPEYKPEEGDKHYAYVGSGEMSEFWTASLYLTPGDEGQQVTVRPDGTILYNKGKGANINGIYYKGQFHPSETPLKAFYESYQQTVLMNGDGEAISVYCVDKETATQTDILYDVVNLEDATHFDEEIASRIRAIAVSGYWGGTESIDPTNSLANVKAMMVASGKFTPEEIALLSPGVALNATQYAIWQLTNPEYDEQVVNVQYLVKNRVAGYNNKTWNTIITTPSAEVACVDLLFKLSNYMATELPGIPASEMSTGDTVLNYKNILKDIQIEVLEKAAGHANNADENNDNDAFVTNVTFDMLQVSEKDNLVAKIVDAENNVYAIGRIAGARQEGEIALTKNSDGTYTFPGVTLIENEETTYTVVVEGVQYLERNVYLFFAGERKISQTMVGYHEGEFYVDVESSVKKTFNVDDPTTVSFESGEASNISFMLIDKKTGEVEFLYKKDIGGETSYEIPEKAGYISAVFIKQAKSGMLWIAEENEVVDVDAVIDCVEENNPSYKGCDAVAFGRGDHDLTYSNGKKAKTQTVTYTFN